MFRNLLGLLIIAGGFMLLAAMIFIDVPTGSKDILNIGTGILLGWGSAVVSFEFGNSRRSGTQSVTVDNTASDPVPVEATK